MRVGIVVNPKHERTERAYASIHTLLRRNGVRYRTASTTRRRAGAEQAAELLDWGARLLLVLGGDGTVRAVAPVLAGTGVPVLIVPTGTANVLTRHIGIPRREQALHLAAEVLSDAPGQALSEGSDRVRRTSVPVNDVAIRDAAGVERHEHFVSLAGVGGDARAVSGHRSALGLLGYTGGALRALFAEQFRAAVDGGTPSPRWALQASKVACPAGPVPVFPGAEVTGEEFALLSVGLGGGKDSRSGARGTDAGGRSVVRRIADWAGVAADIATRGALADPGLVRWTGTELAIDLDLPQPAHLDGDLIGPVRALSISAGRQRLSLLRPPGPPKPEPPAPLRSEPPDP